MTSKDVMLIANDLYFYLFVFFILTIRNRDIAIFTYGNRRFRKFNNSVHDYQKFLGRVYRFEKNKDILFRISTMFFIKIMSISSVVY